MSTNSSSGSASAQASGVNTSSLPRLGPAWRSRGFQPPPAVPPSDPREESSNKQQMLMRSRSGSSGSASYGDKSGNSRNSFSALLQADGNSDEDIGLNGHIQGPNGGKTVDSNLVSDLSSVRRLGSSGSFRSRSDGLMGNTSTNSNRIGGFNSMSRASSSSYSNSSPSPYKSTGRSLADLAARTPATGISRSHSGSYSNTNSSSNISMGSSSRDRPVMSIADDVDRKIIRFTRERLLSMRPQPNISAGLPNVLKHLVSTAIVTKAPQDPVCFEDFDADQIWSQAIPARLSRGVTAGGSIKTNSSNNSINLRVSGEALRSRSETDTFSSGTGSGRWQRGVALPPTSDSLDGLKNKSGSRKADEAEKPEDLWDDPVNLNSASADLSQYGALLDDKTGSPLGKSRGRSGSTGSSGMFDLAQMSEAAQKFESQLHGNKQRTPNQTTHDSNPNFEKDLDLDLDSNLGHRVDPKRPLAFAGTTIRSGSGDDVNVFEDFGAPSEQKKSDVEQQDSVQMESELSATNRLMKMIGVKNTDDATSTNIMTTWGGSGQESANTEKDDEPSKEPMKTEVNGSNLGLFGAPSLITSVPKNPWGNPTPSIGMDSGLSQQPTAMNITEDQHSLHNNIAVEENQHQANIQAQLAAQRQAAQAEAHRQQNTTQQSGRTQYDSQVEQILMERVSNVLEGAWGRTDLGTLLSTLQTEDPRVIPLLGTIEELKTLILRHSNRVAMVSGPGFGGEMAVLVMTNAQYQQQQIQKQREEEFQRQRQMLQNMQALQLAEEEARSREQVATLSAQQQLHKHQQHVRITNDPWFYADPQGNIQGPFKGEEMRQWLEAGYFKGDLPISQNPNGPFHTLTSLFPDSSIAFQPPPVTDTLMQENEAKKQAALAKEEKAREEAKKAARAEELKRIESEKKSNEERLKKQNEAAELLELQKENSKSTEQNSSSAQLKMLLGLNDESQTDDRNGIVVATATNTDANKTMQQSISDVTQPPTQQHPLSPAKTTTNLSGNQRATVNKAAPTGAPAPQPVSVPTPAPAPAPAPIQPAWGGAASATKSTNKKSMSEIQREEARVAARLAKQNQNLGRSSSGGWANVAASGGGGTGWSSGAVKTSRSVSSGVSVPSQVRTKSATVKTSNSSQNSSKVSTQQQTKASVIEDFGVSGKMSSSLESWCKEQMRKLNGSDDLTLVAFCMTLTDPVEIRQYLTAYLGSSSQVGNFATEFINRKGGGKPKQEEWESAGNAKKGRKKKASAK